MIDPDVTIPDLNLKEIKVLGALGRGAKGVVFLVKNDLSGEFLALKVVLKELFKSKNPKADQNQLNLTAGGEYGLVSFEQQVLARLHHPLLPRLRGVLCTKRVLGYAIDYCSGGDLHSLRRKQTEHMFSDDVIRFYAAELVLALEYVHNLGIVYRDLKPENIMIQESGHIMLIDFDLSTKLRRPSSSPPPQPASIPRPGRKIKRFASFRTLCSSTISPEDPSKQRIQSVVPDSDTSEKATSFVGTEEYVAPEMILGKGHDFAVDWWALGVVLYEMLYGKTPFIGSNRKETFHRIVCTAPDLVGQPTPLRNLIGKLLEKDPKQRIGVEEIKGHDFFRGVDWDSVTEVSRPPYIPDRTMTETTEGITRVDVELFVQGILDPQHQPSEADSVF